VGWRGGGNIARPPAVAALVERSDRVFVLMWRSVDLAVLVSLGSGEMFWESFMVEPLAQGPRLAKLMDAEAWKKQEFTLRHERTGLLLSIFSAGDEPPSRSDEGIITVTLRGTYGFAPAPPRSAPLAGLWLRVLRWFACRD